VLSRGLAFSYALIVRFFGGFVNIGGAASATGGDIARRAFTVKTRKIFALAGERNFFREWPTGDGPVLTVNSLPYK